MRMRRRLRSRFGSRADRRQLLELRVIFIIMNHRSSVTQYDLSYMFFSGSLEALRHGAKDRRMIFSGIRTSRLCTRHPADGDPDACHIPH